MNFSAILIVLQIGYRKHTSDAISKVELIQGLAPLIRTEGF